MSHLKEPHVFEHLFSAAEHEHLKSLFFGKEKNFKLDTGFQRHVAEHHQVPEMAVYGEALTEMARLHFGRPHLKLTYPLFVHYKGPDARLPKHVDQNACTYTIDYCLYQSCPWDLWVDTKSYRLEPNQALSYYGNDQPHWREKFPGGPDDYVAMIFFHFADPGHWYFTEGPEYVDVIRYKATKGLI